MDFIFEDDIDEVGSDIEAYCPKCKQDTSHTVITKYEEEVRRVQCSVCGDVHAYRKPRGEVEEEPPEPAAARKRAAAKKLSWQEFINKIGPNKANDRSRPYTIRDHYHEGDIVSHPKFGIGFVTEISENKAEVTFQDDRRLLVHNRPDLAAAMPAIAPTPAPRAVKPSHGKKGKKGQAVPAPVAVAAPAKKAPPPAEPLKPIKKDEKRAAKKTVETQVEPKKAGQKAARAKAAATKKSAAKGKPAAVKPARPAAKPAAAAARKPHRSARPARPAVKAKVKTKKAKAR
jgi:hypothetical protein